MHLFNRFLESSVGENCILHEFISGCPHLFLGETEALEAFPDFIIREESILV